MSYILDALKKSEQQREHGSIPSVQTVHSSSLYYRDEKKTYWPYVLIIAVTLNLIAIVYFIIDKNNTSDINTVSVEHTMVAASAKKTFPVDNTQTPLPEKHEASEKKISNTTNTNTEKQKEKTVLLSTTAAIINTSSNNNSEALSLTYKEKSAVIKQPEKTQKDIISFYDLSDSMQKRLPAIIVTAHIYSSNPLQRSMVINNNVMEEGEYLIDNLILHEITSDGAIFDYAEIRFYYNVVSGWQ